MMASAISSKKVLEFLRDQSFGGEGVTLAHDYDITTENPTIIDAPPHEAEELVVVVNGINFSIKVEEF